MTYESIKKDEDEADFELQKGHILSVGTGDGETLLEILSIDKTTKKIQFRLFSGDSLSFKTSLKAEPEGDATGYTLDVKRVWRMRDYFNGAPTTSLFAQGLTNGRENVYDEIHVAVVDDGGEYSDVPGTILERFEGLSVAKNAQNNAGDSIFWESYINENSNYIYVINSPSTNKASLYAGVYSVGYNATDTAWNFSSVDIKGGNSGTDTFGNAGSGGSADAKYSYQLRDLFDIIGEDAASIKLNFELGIFIGEDTTVKTYNDLVDNTITKLGSRNAAVDKFTQDGTASVTDDSVKLSAVEGTLFLGSTATTQERVDALYGFYTTSSDEYYTSENSLVLTGNVTGKKAGLEFSADNKNEFSLVVRTGYLAVADAPLYTLRITVSGSDRGITWDFENDGEAWSNSRTDTGKINKTTTFQSLQYPTAFHLLGGENGTIGNVTGTDSVIKENLRTGPNVEDSFDVLKNKKELDINLIISGPLNSNKQATLIDIAENRYDSVVFLSPERFLNGGDFIRKSDNDKLNHILDWKGDNLRSSSYTFVDNNWKQVYDRYNSRTRWVPCNGDMAGIVSSLNEPWLSPAGLTNGFIRNALSIAYNPSDSHQDRLYQSSVNSIIRKQGQGLVLWGDRTGQIKASALQSINIRMLFLVIEKALAKYSETLLFELIDEDTMTLARMNINSYLKNVQSRGGIQSFNVIMDESNNTPYTIDNKELHAEIRIDATRTINNILLTFVATKTGAAFNVSG